MEIFSQYCVACRKWAVDKSRSRCDYFAHIQCIRNSDLLCSQDLLSSSLCDVDSFTIALLCIIVIMCPYYAKQQKRPARPFCHSYSYFTTISNCSFRIPHSRPEAHSIRPQNNNHTLTHQRKNTTATKEHSFRTNNSLKYTFSPSIVLFLFCLNFDLIWKLYEWLRAHKRQCQNVVVRKSVNWTRRRAEREKKCRG